MGIIYDTSKSKKPRFARLNFDEMDASSYWLKHYGNYRYLKSLAENPKTSWEEKQQARFEMGIAERKMTFWLRHPNWDQRVVERGKSEIDKVDPAMLKPGTASAHKPMAPAIPAAPTPKLVKRKDLKMSEEQKTISIFRETLERLRKLSGMPLPTTKTEEPVAEATDDMNINAPRSIKSGPYGEYDGNIKDINMPPVDMTVKGKSSKMSFIKSLGKKDDAPAKEDGNKKPEGNPFAKKSEEKKDEAPAKEPAKEKAPEDNKPAFLKKKDEAPKEEKTEKKEEKKKEDTNESFIKYLMVLSGLKK